MAFNELSGDNGKNKKKKIENTEDPRVESFPLCCQHFFYLHRNVKYEALWQINFMNGFRIVWPILECGAII